MKYIENIIIVTESPLTVLIIIRYVTTRLRGGGGGC